MELHEPLTTWQQKTHFVVVRALWAFGLIGLVFGHYCLFTRTDPFYSSVYSFLWCPLIFACDWAVYKLRGKSLLNDRPWEFVLLALWSTPAWLLYEAYNLRLENWCYIQIPLFRDAGSYFMAISFATVLPGVFEMMELAVALIEKYTGGRGIRTRPIAKINWWHTDFQMYVGIAMAILPLIWPKYFFAFTWGFAFFFLDPWLYKRGGRSILGQLKKGDSTRFIALLVSGFICGGLWEGWNLLARSKWIYTVAGFEQLKIFEMPILGFLGFPPFVLECYAMVNFINYFRNGRSWERDPEDNARRKGMRLKPALVAWIVASLLSLATFAGIFYITVSSYSLPIKQVLAGGLSEGTIAALDEAGVIYSHHFMDRWGDVLWNDEEKPPSMDYGDFLALCSLCSLAETKGMGLRYALILMKMRIMDVQELAEWNPERLSRRMGRHIEELVPPPIEARPWQLLGYAREWMLRVNLKVKPSEERVRVWILKAQREVEKGELNLPPHYHYAD